MPFKTNVVVHMNEESIWIEWIQGDPTNWTSTK
jgi:hypothetical protein